MDVLKREETVVKKKKLRIDRLPPLDGALALFVFFLSQSSGLNFSFSHVAKIIQFKCKEVEKVQNVLGP